MTGFTEFRKKISPLILLAVVLIFASGLIKEGEARVYIDIDSPLFQKFPIALTEFRRSGQERAPSDAQITSFADEMARLLDITGYFNIISKDVLSEGRDRTLPDIRFSDWRALGVEYLVRGSFQLVGPTLTVELRLFDVIRGDMLVGRKYTGRMEDRRIMAQRFVSDILTVLTGGAGIFDSKIAFAVRQNRTAEIATINFDGSDFAIQTEIKALTLAPKWSTDGRYIAFTSWRDGNPDLYLLIIRTREIVKLSGFKGLNLAGSWSPDGRRILLTLSIDGNEEIYVMNVDNRQLTRLTHHFAIDVSPAWSPDGRQIAFVSNRAGSPQIYTMNADGGNVRRLTFEGAYNTSPSWSPKGNKIAYEGLIGGRYQIFIMDEEGSVPLQLTSDHYSNESPSWSPDGRYIAFSSRRGGKSKIRIMNSNGTNVRILHDGPDNYMSPSWSPRIR